MSMIGIYASVCRHVCRIVPMSSIPYPYDPIDHDVQFCDKCIDQQVNQCATTLAGMGLAGDAKFNGHAGQAAQQRGQCGIEEYMQQCDAENNYIIYHSIESDSARFSPIEHSVPGAPNWTIETSSHGSNGSFKNNPMPSDSLKNRPMASGRVKNRPMPGSSLKNRPMHSGTLRTTTQTTTTNNAPLFELSYDAIRARFAAIAERVRMQKLVGQFNAMELQPHPSKLSAEENDKLEHMTWLRARLTHALMQGEELDVVMVEFEQRYGFGVLDFAGGMEACCEMLMG